MHPALIRRTRRDMIYRGNLLRVYDLAKDFEEDDLWGITRLVGVRNYFALNGAIMGYVLGRDFTSYRLDGTGKKGPAMVLGACRGENYGLTTRICFNLDRLHVFVICELQL